MIFSELYNDIIEKALIRGLNKNNLDYYTERHHIIPKCEGGSNSKSNFVLLTAKEHYICHRELYEHNKTNNSLFLAWHIMANTKDKRNIRKYDIDCNEYERLKILNSEYMKIKNKEVWNKRTPEEIENFKNKFRGCNNPMFKRKQRELMGVVNSESFVI